MHYVLRRSLTGQIQYRYYDQNHRMLGNAATQILPDFPTLLQCNEMIFSSSFDIQTTIFPGVFRNIVDADDPTILAARIIWLGTGLYELEIFWDDQPLLIQIRSSENTHRFFSKDKLIAEIDVLPPTQQPENWALTIRMNCHVMLSDETRVLLMSFPMLQFAP